jgi:hypothetical protein
MEKLVFALVSGYEESIPHENPDGRSVSLLPSPAGMCRDLYDAARGSSGAAGIKTSDGGGDRRD